jgi:hypothetical protein
MKLTKEELERIELVNKVIDYCKKDDEYLRDIVNEYFQELETTSRGLDGIKETLEEKEEYKSNSGCELEDVTDEFYNEKGELKQ